MILPNTRSDLESLRGTPAFEACLQAAFGSMTTWTLVDGAWVAEEDLRVIERLGYTKASFLAEIDALGFPPPTAPDPPPAPPLEAYEDAIQALVDATAKAARFRDGIHLASYESSTNPLWAAQATAFIAWRDAVWACAYAEMDSVLSGEREQPNVEAFLAEMPEIEWPEAMQ